MASIQFTKRVFSLSSRILQQQEQVIRAPVQVSGVEGKYASALYSSGVKQKTLDKLEKDLNQVKTLYNTSKDFKVFLIRLELFKNYTTILSVICRESNA